MLASPLARKRFLAVATAIIFSLMLYAYLGQMEQRASVEGLVPVPVLAVDVPKGTIITPELLHISLQPLAELPYAWISDAEAIGRVVTQDLTAGTILTGVHLEQSAVNSAEEPGFGEIVRPRSNGDGIFTIGVSASDAADLVRGDHIDLIGVFPARTGKSEQTVLLAERVEVVHVFSEQSEDDGNFYGWPQPTGVTLTISTDRETVHRLALADEFGKIRVIKRSSGLSQKKETASADEGITLDSVLQAGFGTVSSCVNWKGGVSPVLQATHNIQTSPEVIVIKGTTIVSQPTP